MPLYCFLCSCGTREEIRRPMAAAGDPLVCPRCDQLMARDYRAEGPRGQAFEVYGSAAMGVPECVIERAEHVRRRGGWDSFLRDPQTGQRVQINAPGTSLDKRTGDVLIGNRGERRRAIAAHGMVDYA